MVAELQSIFMAAGWVGVGGCGGGGCVAGQIRLYNHTFGHPIGWVFPLGRVWQYHIEINLVKCVIYVHVCMNKSHVQEI